MTDLYTCTADDGFSIWWLGFAAATANFVVLIGTARIRAAWRSLRSDLRKLKGN